MPGRRKGPVPRYAIKFRDVDNGRRGINPNRDRTVFYDPSVQQVWSNDISFRVIWNLSEPELPSGDVIAAGTVFYVFRHEGIGFARVRKNRHLGPYVVVDVKRLSDGEDHRDAWESKNFNAWIPS